MKAHKQGTYQINQVTEVFLDLLWRQAPHQVQGTVQLLITLPKDKQQCLSHSVHRNTKTPCFKAAPAAAACPGILRADRPAVSPLPRLPGETGRAPRTAASVSSGGFRR